MTQVPTGSSEGAEMAVAAAAEGGPKPKRKGLAELVEQNLSEIERALPPGIMDADRFARIIFTEFRKTPKLLLCTAPSFLGALFQTAQLGLEPGGPLGHAFLLPYENSKLSREAGETIVECQLQIGYKGYVELGGRRGILMRAREVREGDEFDFDLGSNEYLIHRWKLNENASRLDKPVIGYWGKVVMPDGKVTFTVMDKSEINARRDRSSAYRASLRYDWMKTPWDTDYDAMARKTVIRAQVPQVALAPELQTALKADEAIVQRAAATGDLSYVYRDAIDAGTTPSPDAAIQVPAPSGSGSVQAVMEGLESDEARNNAVAALTEAFGPGWEDSDPTVLSWLASWLTGDVGAAADARGQTPAEGDQAGTEGTEGAKATETPQDAPGGQAPAPATTEPADADPGPTPPGEPPPASVPGVSDELLAKTKKVIDLWDDETCKRILGEWGLPRTGSLEAKRLKLLMLLAPERARGNKGAEGLF